MLIDIMKLAGDAEFQQRVQAQLVKSCVTAFIEAMNEVQTISISGTPTGGTFAVASIPGAISIQMDGLLLSAKPDVTSLLTTSGLFVGMNAAGNNVAPNATVATIVSQSAITLSANNLLAGNTTLTFSGNPKIVLPWNATRGDVQTIIRSTVGIDDDDVVCTGGPLPLPISVTFCGKLGYQPQQLMTINANSLIGSGTPTPSIVRTTGGMMGQPNHVRRQNRASLVLNSPSVYAQSYVFGAASDPGVQTAFTVAGKSADVTDTMIEAAVINIFNAYL